MRSNNFTKQVLLILLMIIGGSLKAQNDSTYIYQSFFGNDSTRINLYHVITDGDWNYTFTIYNKDTIKINDIPITDFIICATKTGKQAFL